MKLRTSNDWETVLKKVVFSILILAVNYTVCSDIPVSVISLNSLGENTTVEPLFQNETLIESQEISGTGDSLVNITIPSVVNVLSPNTMSTVTPQIVSSGESNLDEVPTPSDDFNATFATHTDDADKVGQVKRRAIRTLMQIFGLPGDADITRNSDQFGPAPEFMIDLYNTITDTFGVTRAKNPYGAHVIRSFMERDSRKYDFFYFNMSASSDGNEKVKETERLVEAELHLYRNPTPHDRLHPSLYLTPFYILSLYQVVDSRNLGIPDLHKLLGVHYVPALGSGWEVFNVTQTVSEWVKGGKPNLGFIVAATSLGGDRVPVTFARRTDVTEGEKSNKQPILVLFNHDSEVEKLTSSLQKNERKQEGRGITEKDETDKDEDAVIPNIPNSSLENPRFHHSLLYKDSIRHPNSVSRFRSRRSKNQTENMETNSTSSLEHRNLTSCSKHDLFISFEAIGWSSWIISPKGYNAYYCAGPCVFPLSHDVSPTNHATLQSIAHELSLAADVGRPCCVPTKLLPISLLYYDDDDNVVLKQYVDMVADTCGCH